MHKLVHEKQVIGVVINETPMGGSGQKGVVSKTVSAQTEVPNHGVTLVKPFTDGTSGAYARACAHRGDPFFWTGHPKK